MPPNPRNKDGLNLSMLGGSLLGVPQSGLPDRTFTRGQGCWNCLHAKSPIDRWFDKRFQKLAYAQRIAIQSKNGENDSEVVHIRRQVEQIDAQMAQQTMFICDVGRTADGNPVGDFVASAFLCDRWTGRDGASLARGTDGKLDDLPEELRDKIDGSEPVTPRELAQRTKQDDDHFEIVESIPDLDDGGLS